MNSQEKLENKSLDKVYQEGSQWVRLANTIIWTMGTLIVPASLGFVGLALNNSGASFPLIRRIILGAGSIFLFSFWVYASRIYKVSSNISRKVLVRIERRWKMEKGVSLYRLQEPLVTRRFKPLRLQFGLFSLQLITLLALIFVWLVIIYFEL